MFSIEPRPIIPRNEQEVPLFSVERRPILPRNEHEVPVLSIQRRPLPPPRNDQASPLETLAKVAAAIGGGIIIGMAIGAAIDAFTETPSQRRRRELDAIRLGLPRGRMSLPKWLRDEISRAHDWRCDYCGVRTTRSTRQIDHARSLAKGGSNELRNLVNACTDCNQLKGAMNAGEFRTLLQRLLDDE